VNFAIIGSLMTDWSSEKQVRCMNIHSPQEFGRAASHDAVFASLRAKLAGEVSSSAMLADLLEKLNGMQEAQARPADFTKRFDAFVARADEHLDVVRPFFPVLVQFLPAHKESLAAAEPRRIEAASESDLTSEVGLAVPTRNSSCLARFPRI
jgi:hypothetical protein